MPSRFALLLVGLSMLVVGCSGLQPSRAEVSDDTGCTSVVPGVRDGVRFQRWRADVPFAEPPPDTVKSKSSTSSRSYMSLTIPTRPMEAPFRLASVAMVFSIALLVIGLLVFTGAFSGTGETAGSRMKTAAAGLGVMLGGAVLGWLGGSRYVFDNATNAEVDVVIGGDVVRLPSRTFVELRVGGSETEVEIRANGKTLERAKLTPDDDFGEVLRRAVLGNGRFLYNVCGANGYKLETVTYGRR